MTENDLHVVALSGGKDSTAMALRLAEMNPEIRYTYVITPTGNELPEMYRHWRWLAETLGNLRPIMGGTLLGIIDSEKMIPNFRARFCTRMLKIEPYAAWLMEQSRNYKKIYSYVGIRADEEEREAGDYSAVPGVISVFPMREWGWRLDDVINYNAQRGAVIPIRTDCALCFYQRLGEWWNLWKDHPEEYEKGAAIERAVGHTFRSPSRDTWPASLDDLRVEFQNGRIPRGGELQKDMIGDMKCRVCRI